MSAVGVDEATLPTYAAAKSSSTRTPAASAAARPVSWKRASAGTGRGGRHGRPTGDVLDCRRGLNPWDSSAREPQAAHVSRVLVALRTEELRVDVQWADAVAEAACGARARGSESVRQAALMRRMRSAAAGSGSTSGWWRLASRRYASATWRRLALRGTPRTAYGSAVCDGIGPGGEFMIRYQPCPAVLATVSVAQQTR